MTLRTTNRLLIACAALAVLAATWMSFATRTEAGANLEKRITIIDEPPKTYTYDAIIGDNGGQNVDSNLGTSEFINPDHCGTAPYCVTIPITVVPPKGLSDIDEYYVRIAVSWNTIVLRGVPVLDNVSATNDLDVYLFNDPVKDGAGVDKNGVIYQSATGDEPESFTMFKPKGNYSLVISNYSGPNTGFKVTTYFTNAKLPTVFESLPPEFTSTGDFSSKPSRVISDAPTPSTPPITAPPVDIAPSLDLPSPPIADQSFDSGFDDVGGALDNGLTTPTVIPKVEPVVELSDPPSAAAMLLWFVAFPLILLALGSAVMLRRQNAAIRAD